MKDSTVSRFAFTVAFALALALSFGNVWAMRSGDVVTTQAFVWVDRSGTATLPEVTSLPLTRLQQFDRPASFEGGSGALWMRWDFAALTGDQQWFIVLQGGAFFNRVDFHQLGRDGVWQAQSAGDHRPVSSWSTPDRLPVFRVDPAATTAWLRIENHPAPLSPSIRLLDARDLKASRDRTVLGLGAYLGFGLLVLFLGWVHIRLYADRVFVAYVTYVFCMLGFQVAFTGMGGLFFWPDWARWNDMAPALFMLWLTAAGIWFVREVSSLERLSRPLNRFVTAWSITGFLYPVIYFLWASPTAFKLLNLYGLLSVLLSMGVCLWAWRKGETYAGWTALGFLPLHLAYPFPALRSAGAIPDSWATQYAVLLGSAIEIPLLLYILHRRAKDFNENRARMRVIDSTDPLTGLTIVPVLLLRLRDTLRRARRGRQTFALVLVDLANHQEIQTTEGRVMADRALVVAASILSEMVRDIDTVCRLSETRFAMLLEAPFRPSDLGSFAQHAVARGLGQAEPLPPHLAPRFRVVTVSLPERSQDIERADDSDVERLLERMHHTLDQLDPRRSIWHLPLSGAANAEPESTASARSA